MSRIIWLVWRSCTIGRLRLSFITTNVFPVIVAPLAIRIVIAISCRVYSVHRIIATIGVHIVAEDALAGRDETVGIDESANGGVIVAALEVVQFCFCIPYIAAVTEGVQGSYNAGGGAERIAPSVVGISCYSCAGAFANSFAPSTLYHREGAVAIGLNIQISWGGFVQVAGRSSPKNPGRCASIVPYDGKRS